jgi:hypothetical protein
MIPTFRCIVKRQHHIYKHQEVDNILEYLTTPTLERGAITKIARDTGIPEGTLLDWHRHRRVDNNWFPLDRGHPQTRALNSDNEAAIADFVRVNYIDAGIGATRTRLNHLCLDVYAAQADDARYLERFCASTTFLRDMQIGQRLPLRTPHQERRTALDESYATYFLNRLIDLANDYPLDLVFSMDESCWRFFEAPRKVLAQKEQRLSNY